MTSASAAVGTVARPASPPPVAAPTLPRVPRVVDRGIAHHDALRAEVWTARGTVKVTGDVEVVTADVGDALAVGGSVSAAAFSCRGSLEVEGAVRVRDLLRLRGTVHAAGLVHAGDLRLDGSARVVGAVTVDRSATVRGGLLAASVTAELLDLDGSATVPGELRATTVLAEFRRRSAFGKVFGRTVRLRGHVPNLVDKAFFHLDPATVERIEADSVELTAVSVAFVRAKEIVLGRHAHVTAAEGTIVRRHPTSSVGPESKSPPPYGLRR